jgi:hypothetical protein
VLVEGGVFCSVAYIRSMTATASYCLLTSGLKGIIILRRILQVYHPLNTTVYSLNLSACSCHIQNLCVASSTPNVYNHTQSINPLYDISQNEEVAE